MSEVVSRGRPWGSGARLGTVARPLAGCARPRGRPEARHERGGARRERLQHERHRPLDPNFGALIAGPGAVVGERSI
jgi:hypothetical protein